MLYRISEVQVVEGNIFLSVTILTADANGSWHDAGNVAKTR